MCALVVFCNPIAISSVGATDGLKSVAEEEYGRNIYARLSVVGDGDGFVPGRVQGKPESTPTLHASSPACFRRHLAWTRHGHHGVWITRGTSSSYLRFAPEDMAHTYGALFFTRFITHFCAPVFAFLAGTGAFLSTSHGKSIPQVSRFLFTRGLWLVILELTVVDFAWGFVPWAQAGVIWILGWSMVAMALIVRLPVRWIAALGLGMIATHNLLDGINPASFGRLSWLWILLHSPGRIPLTADFSFTVRYALIPWVGVMAVGFAFGTVLLRPDRRKWILTLGIGATVLFFLLRGLNAYGNGIARPVIRIPAFCRPVECSTDAFVDGDLILQRAEVSAFSRLPAGDARAGTHPARIA